MDIEIRPYHDADEKAWMRTHAIIMTLSHAWNYCVQERPDYAGSPSTRLVACHGDQIAGLIDVQYDRHPGDICFLKDSVGGYVLEFGRLPEYAGQGLGTRLMAAAQEDALRQGYRRLEYWSQDRRAQRFYRRVGLKEIGRHYRFRMKAPGPVAELLRADRIGLEYVYAVCLPEEWPLVKSKYEIIERHPLEPHLCIGFEARF